MPIVDPLLKIVCIFVFWWGAHYYPALTNYNKITNNFRNRIPLLVLNFWQCDDKLNFGFEEIIDECSFSLIFDIQWHMLFLTYWSTNIKWSSVMLPNSIILIFFFPVLVWIEIVKLTLYNSLTASKIVREMTRDDWFKNCEKNDEKWHIRYIQIKYKIIIIVQYKKSEDVVSVVQYNKNYFKNNIDHSPSRFSL